ncbi:testis-expressed protein 22 [Lemur catta]|uniref:testis-expressed protein 22 n=1 Tax=Lemur catta TaxID=9447 RepID=UPI001E268D34|nr:testis-expressed protein 22 [Lemur catta]
MRRRVVHVCEVCASPRPRSWSSQPHGQEAAPLGQGLSVPSHGLAATVHHNAGHPALQPGPLPPSPPLAPGPHPGTRLAAHAPLLEHALLVFVSAGKQDGREQPFGEQTLVCHARERGATLGADATRQTRGPSPGRAPARRLLPPGPQAAGSPVGTRPGPAGSPGGPSAAPARQAERRAQPPQPEAEPAGGPCLSGSPGARLRPLPARSTAAPADPRPAPRPRRTPSRPGPRGPRFPPPRSDPAEGGPQGFAPGPWGVVRPRRGRPPDPAPSPSVPEVRTSCLLGVAMDGQKLPSQRRTPGSQPSQEHRQPFPPLGPTAARGQPSAQSSTQQGLQTQDWVCEPPERGRPGRRWSVSIDERRRLAVPGGPGRPGAGSPSRGGDIMQTVAQLVSEDVDRDVLFSHPPDSAESSAYRAFLSRSATFWRKATLRSPPS